VVRAGFVASTLAILGGCAHESAQERQLAHLQEDMSRLTNERDVVEKRLSALEVRNEPTKGSSAEAIEPGAVREPEKPTTSDDPDDGAPRPSIKVAGSPTFGRTPRNRRDEPEAALGTPGDGPRPSALDPEARKAYDQALEKARAGRHREGLDLMSAFLVKWPDHPYADNAMYWRAECMNGLGEPQKAMAELESLVSRFPLGNKVPDALAKLAVLYEKQGDAAKAKAAGDRLERDFPKSDAAKRRARKSSDRGHDRPKDVQ
jgi:tol-pal system protein YbgF